MNFLVSLIEYSKERVVYTTVSLKAIDMPSAYYAMRSMIREPYKVLSIVLVDEENNQSAGGKE